MPNNIIPRTNEYFTSTPPFRRLVCRVQGRKRTQYKTDAAAKQPQFVQIGLIKWKVTPHLPLADQPDTHIPWEGAFSLLVLLGVSGVPT